MSNGLFRLRVNHQVKGRLCWLSHLELARALERLVRRTGLPYASTQGFSPHMKIAFGPALPVGVGGLDEYFELWLTTYVPPQEALALLRASTVEDLPVLAVAYVPDDAPSLTADLVLYSYRAIFKGLEAGEAETAFDQLVSQGYLRVEKKDKKGRIQVRELPFDQMLVGTPVVSCRGDEVQVDFTVRATEKGALRPDAFCQQACSGLEGVSLVALTRVSLTQAAG